MKFSALSVLGALAIVASGALSAQAAEDTALWVGIIGYDDKGKFVDFLLDIISRDPDDPIPPIPTIPDEAKQFLDKCVLPYGAYSIMAATNIEDWDATKFSKLITRGDAEALAKAIVKAQKEGYVNIFQSPDVKKAYKRVFTKVLSAIKVQAKFYFLAPPSVMADPACSPQNMTKLLTFHTPNFSNNSKLLKFESVSLSAAALEKCVQTTGGVSKPICADSGDTSACVACSINNGMVASAIGAAALVAFALFF